MRTITDLWTLSLEGGGTGREDVAVWKRHQLAVSPANLLLYSPLDLYCVSEAARGAPVPSTSPPAASQEEDQPS